MDYHFSRRQIALLQGLADNKMHKVIAMEQKISNETLAYHKRELRRKLNATSDIEIIFKAIDAGLIHKPKYAK